MKLLQKIGNELDILNEKDKFLKDKNDHIFLRNNIIQNRHKCM